MIVRGPNSSVLFHVTELLFCIYVKHFLPSIFNSVDFWNGISRIMLAIELADINVIRELGIFLMEMFRDNHFALQQGTKPQNKQFGVR